MFDMLRAIMKNLFTKPATRRYPYSKRESFENVRGCIDVDIDKCIFCGICQKKCVSNAIKVDKEHRTWEIDSYKCIVCNACTETCPKKCIVSDCCYKTPDCVREVLKRKKEEKEDA
ncbi:MAG: 4Fe-4S dicluster domain-containing protein [Deltaproteobacteria bacterium]